jgi:hypothetical protein
LKAKERRAATDFLSDNLRALGVERERGRSSGKERVQGSSEANSSRDFRQKMELFSPSASSERGGDIYNTDRNFLLLSDYHPTEGE